MKLKLLELFGGIGACSKALERLGIDFEIVDYVEIDKFAVKSFNAIHGTNFEPQDICKWDKELEVDLIMHGSPCQSISAAGLQHGADKGSGTRSSLMWETVRIVEKLRPKYVIWENVKNLISKRHIHNFKDYLKVMEDLGYQSFYQVLNAKDYGIPQNRERVFTVSIRKDIDVSKDIKPSVYKNFDREKNEIKNAKQDIYNCSCESAWQDNKVGINLCPTIRATNNNTFILENNIDFEFPQKQELKIKLKDLLEEDVEDKYYLSDRMVDYISADNEKWTGNNEKSLINKTIASAINTGEGSRRCDASNYISKQLDENFNLKGLSYIRNFGSKGKLQKNNTCNTLTASMGTGGGNVPLVKVIKKRDDYE
ncbi:MAG: DNA cytosine methyltransferase [Firmicutes bacterium]|nr:DNA cytosine methyltransferase [Bacillota bacterium]